MQSLKDGVLEDESLGFQWRENLPHFKGHCLGKTHAVLSKARCARLSDLALAVAAAAYQRTLVPGNCGGRAVICEETTAEFVGRRLNRSTFPAGKYNLFSIFLNCFWRVN